jgi:NADH-quinone oxidoreductase subunit L
LIPLLPLLGAAISMIFGRKMRRQSVHLVAVGAVVASCTIALIAVFGHLFGDVSLWSLRAEWLKSPVDAPRLVDNVYTWIASGSVSIPIGFLMDPLSAVMVLVVTFVGALIHIYSCGYMANDEDYARYFAYLNLFTGAMLILVLADSLPLLFVGWEGVGLCSYLLIGFWYKKDANASAGKKAFIVNRIGDFGFLLGMLLLWATAGTLDFVELNNPDIHAALNDKVWHFFATGETDKLGQMEYLLNVRPVDLITLCLFVGATGKSAQLPLYVWLPDAMAGPTPVSALIHAATMVTAGVYMIVRLNGIYTLAPNIMLIVATVGMLTALFSATIAFAQNDIKKVLAYSTVSQLGFMFAAAGVGAFTAAIFHLATHAFFKACLFMDSGAVIHALHEEQDIRKMGGLRKKLPVTHWTFLVSTLAIAGLPLFSGFFSKDAIIMGSLVNEFVKVPGVPRLAAAAGLQWFLYIGLTIASVMTAFYMFRLYCLTFLGEPRTKQETLEHLHAPSNSMRWPLIILALGATLIGVLGAPPLLAGPHGIGALFLVLALITAAVLIWIAFRWASDIDPEHGRDDPYTQWGLIKIPLLVGAAGMVFLGIWAVSGKALLGFGMPAGWLHHWLKSSLPSDHLIQVQQAYRAEGNPAHASHGTEMWMMSVAVIGALLGTVISLALYRKGPSKTVANLTESIKPVHRGALNKWYVDEFYHLVVVRPLTWFAKALRVGVDEWLVDRFLVTGVAWTVYSVGWLGSRIQTGRARQYLAAILVGLAALVLLATRPVGSFDVKVAGSQVVVKAGDAGDQIIGVEKGPNRLQVKWDFTGDGEVDRTSVKPGDPVTWRYPKPGRKRIRMIVKDPRFGKTRITDRVITIREGR